MQNSEEMIDSLIKSVDKDRIKLAFALHNLKKSTNWKKTTYGSWTSFCNKKVAISLSSVYKYLKIVESMVARNYQFSESSLIVRTIGWTRFCVGINKINSKIPVEEFIEKFQFVNINEKPSYGEPSNTGLVKFAFELSEEDAAVLTGILLSKGMREKSNYRINASLAMSKLINDEFKES